MLNFLLIFSIYCKERVSIVCLILNYLNTKKKIKVEKDIEEVPSDSKNKFHSWVNNMCGCVNAIYKSSRNTLL